MSKLDYISASVPPLSDIDSVRRSIGGAPVSFTQGGDFANGDITFGQIQVQDETITIDSVYISFTSAASDGAAAGTALDPLLVNIKASLDLTLDELVIVLQATANVDIAKATYTKGGTTILNIDYDTVGIAGNVAIAASIATVSAATLTGGTDTPTITLDSGHSTVALDQATNQAMILASGVEFQEHTIVLTTKSTGDLILTPIALTGGTTLTFGTANMFCKLKFLGGSWQVIANTATLA
ncbi:hypothetical protein KAR91_00300 [Candidatus Pacearchaeota archaeon]|nr:hypothetical protein [Candidatus Pacearchaeota archaeon]